MKNIEREAASVRFHEMGMWACSVVAHAVRKSLGMRPTDRSKCEEADETIRGHVRLRGEQCRATAKSLVVLLLLSILSACGSTSAPPPPAVTVTVTPESASVLLGATQTFQATVTGTPDMAVTWEVNGQAAGNSSVGTISASGTYTAPNVLPSPASVTVTAVSVASPSVSGSASVTLHDDIVVEISPTSASVATNAAQGFTATVTGSGMPSTAVTWSVNGVAGGNSTVGTIVANGAASATYTAPASVPSPANVTVTATSVADTTKSVSAAVTIACASSTGLSPPSASVALGLTQAFTASLCPASGVQIVWDVDGIAGGNSSVGTITAHGGQTAVYMAPEAIPSPNPVTVHATAGVAEASASVTITSDVTVTVSPLSASVGVNQRASFSATVSGTTDEAVTWSVNGVANGNATVGQVCVTGSNPCTAPSGATTGSIDFLAPANVPATNPVTLAATSAADVTKSGNALVTITGPPPSVAVTLSPGYAFVAPTGSENTVQFVAHVTGTTNTSVSWSVASEVVGQGCGGAACGTVSATGLYTAPTIAPSPNEIAVTATSAADATKSATAMVALTSGPAIEVVLPSSVMAGAVEGFPLSVEGVNFVAGSGSGSSQVLLNGTARSTTCQSATQCSIALTPADVESAATATLQVQNPGPPGALSNVVPFVVVPFDDSRETITLTAGSPSATGLNFVVTEPTTAAEGSPIDVDAIGPLANQNCTLGAAPVIVTRPGSGTETMSLCIHGNGLDPSFTYAFTGPGSGDISVTASAVTGLFPNTIELDLQISNTTEAGLRTLVITTINNDRAIATGLLEVD